MPQPVLRNSLILLTVAIFIAISANGDDTPVIREENVKLVSFIS